MYYPGRFERKYNSISISIFCNLNKFEKLVQI